ncbi:MAG: hypothetical protein EU549_00225 [Promethearchaeota archaeon]|nr:MAG: hypothetical protein EU549_00225 [Candidatus Lokiarchaeota archaeon]
MAFLKLNNIEKKIIDIVGNLVEENRQIKIKELFSLAKRNLNLSDSKIDSAIWGLIEKKYIVDGSKLTKLSVLKNENRQNILKLVFDHPGIHIRQIREDLTMGSYLSYWHLNILEKFGYIRRKPYKNKVVFYPYFLPEQYESIFQVLNDQKAYEINEFIFEQEKTTLKEIIKHLNLESRLALKILDALLETRLITLEKEQEIDYYYGNLQMLKSYIESWQEKDDEFEKLMKSIISKKPKEITLEKRVEIKREYDYVGGNIRYKVAVRNNSEKSISQIRVMLTPVDQFTFKNDLKKIDKLDPGESRGVDFLLTPMTCGRSNVYGTVSYVGQDGEPSSRTIKPKLIWVKCPLVSSVKADLKELLEWQSDLRNGETNMEYSGLTKMAAFDIVSNQISALDLAVVSTDNEHLKGIYSGIAKVTNSKIVVEIEMLDKSIKISVWASDLKEVTGFLAYIKNMVRIALDMSSSIRMKEEKIEQQILNAFECAERLNQLFEYCESNWNLSDVIILLKEIVRKVERDLPSLPIEINHWISDLEPHLSDDATLNDQSSIYIEYDTFNLLKRVYDLIGSNLDMYKSTFLDDVHTIKMIEEKFNSLQNQLIEIEKKYTTRILVFLLVIEDNSGLSLVEHGFKDKRLDPDLISGFLTAIQSFGMELTTAPTEMKKLAYKNFEIEINVGDYIRAALFLSGPCSNFLVKKLVEFINKFEQAFEKPLKNWTGDISKFEDAPQLVKEVFE